MDALNSRSLGKANPLRDGDAKSWISRAAAYSAADCQIAEVLFPLGSFYFRSGRELMKGGCWLEIDHSHYTI